MRKNNNIWRILCLIVIVTGIMFNMLILNTIFENNLVFNSDNFLNTSSSSINIYTPENKTYTKAMSGYYLGTTGFEDTENGLLPSNMDDSASGSNCQATVVSEKGAHNKVVHIDDDGVSTRVRLDYNFTDLDYGFLEFWIYAEDASDGIVMQLWDDDTATPAIQFQIGGDKWNYYTSSTWFTIPALDGVYDPQDNTWYHLVIHFRGNGALAYQGLNENQYKLIIDGHDSGGLNFRTPGTSLERLRFFTGDTLISDFWVDAFGVGSDPDYTLGDNLKEGLLLSFNNSVNLDWMGYSLDRQNNITIEGNSTIRIPGSGTHSLQVYGNDSIGTVFQSAIRYFSIEYIKIISPENKTYTKAMSGYYLGTTGFEDTENGLLPSNMDDSASGSNCQATVVSEKGAHNKVVHIDDDGVSTRVRLDYNFTDLDYGFLEFWIYAEDASDGIVMQLWDDDTATPAIQFQIGGDKWNYYTNSTWFTIPALDGVYDPQDNTWYHLAIHFRGNGALAYQGLNENQYKLIIDGHDSGGLNFRTPGTSLERLRFFTGDTLTSDFWVDAFGVGSDPDYTLGDNLKEGLLLSFNNSVNLDWMGYSLDEQGYIDIFGNTTIPFPLDGYCSIQVFGNDSIGANFHSKKQFFSVNALPPVIVLNNPLVGNFFDEIAPNFNINIVDVFLDSTWYTLDNGLTNVTFTGLTGTINQGEWDKFSDGPLTIKFYANDTNAHISSTSVDINKDTTDPAIIINYPSSSETFSTLPPTYNITILEVNIDTQWYSVDGGATTLPLTQLIGTIDSSAWNSLPSGEVTIRFYVRDKAGNEHYEEVMIIKESEQLPPPEIPGFNILLISLSFSSGLLYIVLTIKKKIINQI